MYVYFYAANMYITTHIECPQRLYDVISNGLKQKSSTVVELTIVLINPHISHIHPSVSAHIPARVRVCAHGIVQAEGSTGRVRPR